MIAEIGIVSLGIAFFIAPIASLLALWGAIAKYETPAKSARNLLVTILGLLTLACLLLIYGQWTGEYSIAYVTNVSSNAQPSLLKITALWGSQAGSMLFYSWMLALFSTVAVLLNWQSQQRLIAWVMVFTLGTLSFFLLMNVFFENPFERYWMSPSGDPASVEVAVLQPEGKVVGYPWKTTLFDRETETVETFTAFTASSTEMPLLLNPRYAPVSSQWARYDGNGLNPLLRHPGMIIHPPMLYLGFTGFVIPFAFAMAALCVGQMGAEWILAVRRWSLIAWMFLSIGLVLGGRWAYDVLGWGGYWGWDPVENAAFLPWLTGTAFLHSVMIQEKRGMLKGWNMLMIITTYLLVLLGTMATRTGLLSSVHSFAKSDLAIPMGGFFALTLLGSIGIYLYRGNQGYFKGDHEIEGVLSRESMFMLNNWVFFALTIVVFWGSWAEKITDFMMQLGLMHSVITLGQDYYEVPAAILFLIIYILMGVAPLVAWRRATANRLGNALQVPLALTVLLIPVIFWRTEASVGATIAGAIITFAGIATLVEISKGVQARHQTHREGYGVALYRLMQRNRRRYGGYVIHLGVVVMGIGILGSSVFQQVNTYTLNPGETMPVGPYTGYYEKLTDATAVDARGMTVADIQLTKNGKFIENLRPRRDFFTTGSPMSIAGVHSTLKADSYILLMQWEGNRATFRVYYNPLINLVWFGSYMLVLGTLIAAWPERQTAPVLRRQRMAQPVAVGVGD